MARLLRFAGARAEVPEHREDRVKRMVLLECQAMARRRRRRRHAAAGVVLAIAAGVVLAIRPGAPPARPFAVRDTVAIVERVQGGGARLTTPSGAGSPASVAVSDEVKAGDLIDAAADGRVGLRLAQGASLRLDRGSQARVIATASIELVAGGLYVDSGPDAPALEVRTALGTVRDVGTQFEVRIEAASVRVRVRSGAIEVQRGPEVFPASPGTELTVTAVAVERRTIPSHGPDWEWAASVAPILATDGRPLGTFLDQLCREQGWTLTYAQPSLAVEASGIILHGDIAGLSPRDALRVALSTSGLEHRFENGHLTVVRATAP